MRALRLPRRSNGVMADFAVVLDEISFVSNVYDLADTKAFLLILRSGVKLVCNITDFPGCEARMIALREYVALQLDTMDPTGFDDLFETPLASE